MTDHQQKSATAGYDKQDPNPLLVGIATISILFFTFISGFAVQAYFFKEAREAYNEQVLESPNEQWNKLRADAQTRLHGYGWIDARTGVAHMPVEKAMELVVADAAKPKSTPAPVPDKKTPAKQPAKATKK